MTTEQDVVRPVNSGATFEPAIGGSTQGLGEHLLKEGDLKTPEAFAKVRSEALTIIGRCKPFDRTKGQRTGLVVGYVQSGKTMSMMTVASLARDNGCRIVVLLAGVTTNLLKQNSTRFRDTLRAAAEGRDHWLIINSEDGRLGNYSQTLPKAVLEWRDKEFPEEEQRTLFFSVLKNHAHLDWLGGLFAKEGLADIPALILDDEADQAGLNVGDDEEPSTTYARIAKIRAALPNHTYLQYTATPQAPLLISIDDMLSPAFAELVEPGEGYTGGMTFFPEKAAHPHVINIPATDQFEPGAAPDAPPSSLIEALAVFFVGCAVCRKRGKPKVRSMLIHPSARNADHQQFFTWAQQIQKRWNDCLAVDDDDRADTLEELKVGYTELAKTDPDLPSYADLFPQLKLTLSRTLVKKVNSEDGTEVDWAAGDVILVGGEKLNRGYTVEGLLVTYMPRGSGGWNADTIQQRARFFGYKASYLSLCRVYLHQEVHNAFSNYVVHERDVRRQLKEHRGKPLREWRRAFFLDAKMRPTRTNVISVATFRVNKDKHWFVQRYPHVDDEAVKFNRELLQKFEATITRTKGSKAFRGAPVAETTLDHVLSNLLLEFKAPREAAAWYAHLVSLSDQRVDNPGQPVTLVFLGADDDPRDRSPEKKNDALTLHQGKSSAKEGGLAGDKELLGDGPITLQIHRVRVKGAPQLGAVAALALYSVRDHDVFGGAGA